MDFVGAGAQKAGTSWIYACLYEHPELCMPFKEVHFFSRERYETLGLPWYEDRFKTCSVGTLKGEYSTSYMYHPLAAARIKKDYPHAKVIMSLRNPADRAYSHYINAIKSTEITKDTTFDAFCEAREDALGQGLYAEQVQRYIDLFPREQLLILIYEDSKVDPLGFIQSIYRFLGVNDTFVPSLLERKVNVARKPRYIALDTYMIRVAETLRSLRLDKLVWMIKKSGLPDIIRTVNTESNVEDLVLPTETRDRLQHYFAADVAALSTLIDRDLSLTWK